MELNDLKNSDAEDVHFLSLKERILLLQNVENKNTGKTTPKLKRVHSISDSDDSDCDKKSIGEKLQLPFVKDSTPVTGDNEVILLSDSEDELPMLDFFKKTSEDLDHMCFIENTKKNYVADINIDYKQVAYGTTENLDEIIKVSKTTKKYKKSPAKHAKNIDKDIAKQQKLELLEEKKKEKELAKQLKELEKETQRSKKPEECLKAMKVIVDHTLIQENDSQDVFFALDEGNVKYSIEENPINCSVAWSKTVIDATIENKQVLKTEREELENVLVLLIPNDSFIKMVHASMQKSKGKVTHETILSDYIVNVTSLFPQMKITCIVLGLEKYIKTLKESESYDVTLKKIAKHLPKLTIEEAIVEVQLQADVNFTFVNTMRELGDLLFRFTKAIAEAPHKREKQHQKDLAFSWYAEADTSCPVKLGKERSTFIKLWQQQLQQFQNVSQEMAEAIAAMYSSPESLIRAYTQCTTTNEAENLLQDIVVRRNYGPLGTQRRIGPELSYKIYLFFMSQDGNQILQR